MDKLPVLTDAIFETTIGQFTRNDNYCKEALRQIKEINPKLYEFISRTPESIFGMDKLDLIYAGSENDEDFSDKLQLALLLHTVMLLKIVNNQIESNELREMYEKEED